MKALAFGVLLLCISPYSFSSSLSEIEELQNAVKVLTNDYENRIAKLEKQLQLLVETNQSQNALIEQKIVEVVQEVEDIVLAPVPTTRSANTFNPAIGVIFIGNLANNISDQEFVIPGFSLPEESGPISEGFSLGETEINLNTNVDDKFFANLTFALGGGEGEVELEEAYIQTLAMPWGLSLSAGRFFSGIGYLNSFHAHSDNFVNRPLAYDVFLGGQYKDDGIQVRWLSPTNQYLEMGFEILRGDAFPSAGASRNGKGAYTLFAETGGDIGFNASWKAGIGLLHAEVEGRTIDPEDEDGSFFSGDSELVNLNFVWKWTPTEYASSHKLEVKGEYFWREEDGLLAGTQYFGDQSGWYLEGSWQFRPQWRFSSRFDQVNADNTTDVAQVLADDETSSRYAFAFEWRNSEFSRIRLQLNTGHNNLDSDNRWVLQYLHSIGAHGAHRY